MTAYKLYWREGSGSMIAEAALTWAGLPIERHRVEKSDGYDKSPAFLAINPLGQIPVIMTPDGTIVTESSTIILIAAEANPSAGLLPPTGTAGRAKSVRWLMMMAAAMYPAALRMFYPDRYATTKDETTTNGIRQHAEAEMDRYFAIVAEAIEGPFLLGSTMSIADVYLAMLADWHPPAMAIPAIARLKAAVLTHEAVLSAWKNHDYAL